MKAIKAILLLLVSMAMALFIGGVVNQVGTAYFGITVPVLEVALTVMAAGVVLDLGYRFVKRTGYAFAIQQEFWLSYIIDNLFRNNDFVNFSDSDDDYVLQGSIVHIPTAGAKPTIVKNRSSFPATAVGRTDNDIVYPLDIYTSDPVVIREAEKMEISYDKIGSVIGDHVNGLSETRADDLLIKWAGGTTNTILRTTGAADGEALSTSATGTRKALTKDDLRKAAAVMDRQNIPAYDRYAIIPSDMYQQLLTDSALLARDGIFGGEVDLKKGIVGELYGFKLIKRSSTVVFDNAATPVLKAFGAAGAATDNMAVLCWQKNCVTKAIGEIKFFEDIGQPTQYGDVYSALVKAGGRVKRGAGLVPIVQIP